MHFKLTKTTIIIIFLLILLLPLVTYVGIKVNEYRDAQLYLLEAKRLSNDGKYQEAIDRLNEAKSKWSPIKTKLEVDKTIEESKILLISSNNFILGKELFDKNMFKDSLKPLRKVVKGDINYSVAESLIDIAEMKEEEPTKKDVAAASTQEIVVQQYVPTQVIIPTVTDYTDLCKAKKQQMAGQIAISANKAEAQAEQQAKSDPMFYQVWLNMAPNIQTLMGNWSVKTLGEYEAYCLTHDGDDSGWKPSSGPFDGIKW